MKRMFFSLKRKQKVVFMYAPRYEFSGSTIMRGKQLASIIKDHYGATLNVSYKSLSTRPKNSFIFLTKGAVTDITPEQIEELTKRGNYVVLDPVDNPLNEIKAHLASGVVAASLEAYDDYKKGGFKSYFVHHHVDTRLKRNSRSPSQSQLHCGYFGELINTIRTEHIASYVDFVQVDTGKQSTDWLSEPPKYNLHYAVRSNNVEAHKPFLKGFTAAACHANIIIQSDQKEAIRWLGDDYPYLLKPNPDEDDIIAMLTYIQKDFGSAQWHKALERMEFINTQISDRAIARQFYEMLQAITSK